MAKPKGDGSKSSRKKVTEDSRGMGSNLTAIREAAEPIVKRLLELQDQMDSDMGGYKADFEKLYEEGAAAIGCKQTVLKQEFRRALKNKRQAEKEAEMTPAERDQVEALRAALEGTPFGEFFAGQLAKAVSA